MRDQYKQAGVDVEAGYQAVDRMKQHVKRTHRREVMGGLGSFGGMFDFSMLSYKEPVLISGTDGVGTKLKLAFDMNRHDTIGIDAVAMCVNDIVAQGAEPLFFQDYIACGKNEPERIEAIVKGIADGCEQSGCALIGGETAEMPGMYKEEEYDLAGFVVGGAEKSQLITGKDVNAGDVLIGLASSGVHSNGFSLVRKWIEEYGLDLQAGYKCLDQTFDQSLGDVLLTPTKIYTKAIQEVQQHVTIKAISHITGGGFEENIPRMFDDAYGASIEKGSWPVPSVFTFFSEVTGMEEQDMMSIFNMGIGMVLAVSPEDADAAIAAIQQAGEEAYTIGTVIEGQGVTYR
ncbi:phosphoribosylformylglycinamidine cyclo-ligase [Pontibacillus yanchengensis]|uniref:Phosphoribosylformylglycinamidine cyclo-ligase n=1 Tax=Pontibacillus yanchengensis Y32 TaxID=1385514 RepID=A0A0A2TPT7_9BACI|nr:phosphoribosylformylglycinamidine cyclo-ligase [Pontibacillus yanchengensis]KGP71315.1 phosphoribosylaminoimidazole synthetase [Pontibacillus yanchengensis Y32]